MRRTLSIALLLVAVTLAVFGRTAGFDFAGLDDDAYVQRHELFVDGVEWSDVAGAFRAEWQTANWHPLTRLSLLLDAALFGSDEAGPYHAVNVLWHVAGVLLLFGALRAMTGRELEAAFVAAVYAIHPLHVEPVAWVSSRKDVLAGALWWGATWLHVLAVRQGSRRARYGALAVCALALMAKPVVVTLPCTLLLFDLWPLRDRIDRAAVVEKLPWFALAAVTSVATWLAQSAAGAVARLDHIALGDRLANAVVAYAVYLRQTVWPFGLTFYYPHPTSAGQDPLTAGDVVLAGALLAALSALALWAWRRGERAPLVGWLFFLGVLVPMIGVVQVGEAAHADRYTYLPLVGLAIAVVFPLGRVVRRHGGAWPRVAVAGGLLLCGAWAAIAARQVSVWRDAPSTLEHAIRHTPANRLAHYNLGYWLQQHGDGEGAAREFAAALAIDPEDAASAVNLGLLHVLRGEREQGMARIEQGLEAEPGHVRGNLNLAVALVQRGGPGDLDRADAALARVLASDAPDYREDRARARHMWPELAAQRGDVDTAADRFERMVEQAPDDAELVARAVVRLAANPDATRRRRALALARRLVDEQALPAARALELRAVAELANGDAAAAVASLRSALAVAGADAEARERLQRRLARLERH